MVGQGPTIDPNQDSQRFFLAMNSTISELHEVLATFSPFENETELLYKLPDFWKTAVWLATLMSLVTGWKMKHLMFKYIAKTGFRDQPINWLILTEQTVHLFCGSLVLVSYLTSQSLELSVGDMLGSSTPVILHKSPFYPTPKQTSQVFIYR